MESLSFEEENIIKEIRNPFRLKKEQNYTEKETKKRARKETKAIEERILRDTKNVFEHKKEEENYHKAVKVSKFWSNN